MTWPDTDDKLRIRLAKKLGIKRIEDPIWSYLAEERHVAAARDESYKEGMDLLAGQVRDLRRHFRRVSPAAPRVRRRAIRIKSAISEDESLRARAFSAALGHLASGREEVRQVRLRFFEGRVLTEREGIALLDSDLPRYFDEEFFSARGIPLVGHRARAVFLGRGGREIAFYSASSSVFRVEWKGRREDIPYPVQLYLPITRPDCPQLSILRHPMARPAANQGFRNRSGRVLPSSVFGQLRDVSLKLVKDYQWSESDATWFLLTGAVPYLDPAVVEPEGFLGSSYWRVRLTLTVDAWLRPGTVLRIYRQAQRQLLEGRSRPLSKRNLALFEFVVTRTEADAASRSWRGLMASWNHGCPLLSWQYHDPRRFHRDFVRARRALLLPKYTWL